VQLYFFLLVILSLSCGSMPPSDVGVVQSGGAAIGMVTAWVLLCHVSARLCGLQVQRERVDPLIGARIIERQLSLFRWLGLAVVVLCLGGFGLARSLHSISLLEQSMFLQAVILLAPGLAITLGTWSAEHLYGVMLGYTDKGFPGYLLAMWQIFRGGIAWLVAPVLLLLLLTDVIALLPVDADYVTTLTAVTIILFVPLGLPTLIRYLFKTEALKEEEEAWISGLLDAAGLRRTRTVRWNTEGRSFNAMVAGFIPPLRTLLISDRLIDELPRDQFAMVVLHEAAHLRRRHVPLRMLAIAPAWAAAAAVTHYFGQQSWAVAVGTMLGILFTLVVLRWVAWRTEMDADLQACRLAAQIGPRVADCPPTYQEAAQALSAALRRVTLEVPESRKATWLHPGVEERIESMQRQSDLPADPVGQWVSV